MASMSIRTLLAVAVLIVLAGCGGDSATREVRLLAPVGIAKDVADFEEKAGCRVDLRVYDEGEDIGAIARRRDIDAIAAPTPAGGVAHVSEELVKLMLDGGVVVTIPRSLASAFNATDVRSAGRRQISWSIREDGDNDDCARRWIAHATSQ
jgi:ABC-type glycerol-3-phosphate transport system substrate-binding protein